MTERTKLRETQICRKSIKTQDPRPHCAMGLPPHHSRSSCTMRPRVKFPPTCVRLATHAAPWYQSLIVTVLGPLGFYNIDLLNFTSRRELFKVTFQTLLIETATKNLPQVLVLKNCLLHLFLEYCWFFPSVFDI